MTIIHISPKRLLLGNSIKTVVLCDKKEAARTQLGRWLRHQSSSLCRSKFRIVKEPVRVISRIKRIHRHDGFKLLINVWALLRDEPADGLVRQ